MSTEAEDRAAAIAAAKRAQADATKATDAAATASRDAGTYSDIPTNDSNSPSIGGWAKYVTSGGKPQANIHMDEVPGVLAKAPGAAWAAVTAPKTGAHGAGTAVTSAGGGNSSEGLDNDLKGIATQIAFENSLTGSGEAPKAPPDFYKQQGTDYSSLGAERGKSDYESSLIDAPKRMQDAIVETEQTKEQRAAAVGQLYDQEAQRSAHVAAARQHRREADALALQGRQDKLDKATQFYTDDLADQGKFWTNPGNIISAIAFSLMPMFGGDPQGGAKLINQAIDRDMSARQHAAEGTLGALRSNLAGYHKLTEDRQAGDLLADSEARRVAANEVARISQKFESPLSQASAKAAIADLQQRSGMARMEAFRAWVNSPAQKMAQQLHDARAKGFDGAYQSMNQVSASTKGNIAGSPTVAQTTGNSGGTVGGFSSPAIAAVANAAPQAAVKAVLDGRIKGSSDIAEMLRRQIEAEANTAAAKGPEAVRQKKFEIVQRYRAEGEKNEALTKVAPRLASTSDIQSKIDLIERSETARGADAGKFLDSARNYMPSGWVDRYEKYKMRTAGSVTPGSAEEYEQLKSSARQMFRQQVNAEVNGYIHANAGGAVSKDEAERMSTVVSQDSSLPEIKAFIHNQSIVAKKEESAALSKLSPTAAMMYLLRMGAGRNYQVNSEGRPPPVSGPGEYVSAPKGFIGPPR